MKERERDNENRGRERKRLRMEDAKEGGRIEMEGGSEGGREGGREIKSFPLFSFFSGWDSLIIMIYEALS